MKLLTVLSENLDDPSQTEIIGNNGAAFHDAMVAHAFVMAFEMVNAHLNDNIQLINALRAIQEYVDESMDGWGLAEAKIQAILKNNRVFN